MGGKFITTEPLEREGETGEGLVWQLVQNTFTSRNCLGYWRYPIFSRVGKSRREPDILIADRQLGLIVIEVKSLTIEQIVNINGHRWEYRNFYASYGSPYQQAENQLFALLGYCDREPSLQGKITARVLVALPHITQQQWQHRGFDNLPTNPPLIFAEQLNLKLIDRIQNTTPIIPGSQLSEQQWQLLLAVLSGNPVYCQSPRRVLAPPQSRGKIANQLRSHISQLDLQQELLGKQIPPGAQRIRGIAGSGKTVILCQKAAHMHLKHPDWHIALVFFSRSLYWVMVDKVDQWLRRFSNNEVGYDSRNSRLRILHGWGGRKQPGLYSLLCQYAGVERLKANQTTSKQPHEALAEVCTHLLKSTPIPQLFDAILVDEGQDFVVDEEYKFAGKQPFYWLAYQALRPVNPLQPDQRRLIWAYDEAQSLKSLRTPTASELLGEELGHLVTGIYSNNIKKTAILSHCYRTPPAILRVAQAMGMGWLRLGGMLTGVMREEDWQGIGYQLVRGRQSKNPQLIQQQQPHPISKLWQGELVELQIYASRQQELTALADNIFANLRYDDLRPSREILVIVLGKSFAAMQLATAVAEFLLNQGIDIYIPGARDCNLLKVDSYNYKPNQFWCEGAVTVSRIHRAKGHEAYLVYLVGLDQVAQDEANLSLRNQLLVALTRAKAWVKVSGIGSYPLYREMYRTIKSGDSFTLRNNHHPRREIGVSDAGELLQRYSAGSRNFQHLNLPRINLPGADLRGANLLRAILVGANLRDAQLQGVKLVIADLQGADLRRANLSKAKLIGANLRCANLAGANLHRADLSDADLTGTNFQGAILTEAILPEGIDL